VAKAILYATGKRIRSTPFKSHDLSWSWGGDTLVSVLRRACWGTARPVLFC